MGENYGFCGVVPAKYSLHGCCWQNIDSVRLAFGILKCSGATKQLRRFWLRQNDEQKQTKANTEILAAPE